MDNWINISYLLAEAVGDGSRPKSEMGQVILRDSIQTLLEKGPVPAAYSDIRDRVLVKVNGCGGCSEAVGKVVEVIAVGLVPFPRALHQTGDWMATLLDPLVRVDAALPAYDPTVATGVIDGSFRFLAQFSGNPGVVEGLEELLDKTAGDLVEILRAMIKQFDGTRGPITDGYNPSLKSLMGIGTLGKDGQHKFAKQVQAWVLAQDPSSVKHYARVRQFYDRLHAVHFDHKPGWNKDILQATMRGISKGVLGWLNLDDMDQWRLFNMLEPVLGTIESNRPLLKRPAV